MEFTDFEKDGVLCIVTPDIGSLISRILGENWWHIRPDHIYYFTEETISLLLLSQGYRGLKDWQIQMDLQFKLLDFPF